MKVLILTTSYPRTKDDDSSVFIARFAEALVAAGLSVDVVVPLDDREPLEEERGGVRIHRFRYGVFSKGALAFGASLFGNLSARPWLLFQVPLLLIQMASVAWRLVRTYRKQGEEVIVHGQWILAGASAVLLRTLCGQPFVLSLRGSDMLLIRFKVTRLLLGAVMHLAWKVVTVSEDFQSQLRHFFPRLSFKVHFISNGITEFNESHSASIVSQRSLISVGSLRPAKRIEWLLEIAGELKNEGYELYLIGRLDDDHYVRQLRAIAESEGIADRVHFIGAISPSEVGHFLRGARYVLTASEREGRPNAVLEALLSKCVVIASDIPAHREIITEGDNGLLFSDPKDAARKIRRVDEQPGDYERLRERARFSVRELTWASCVARHLTVYKG